MRKPHRPFTLLIKPSELLVLALLAAGMGGILGAALALNGFKAGSESHEPTQVLPVPLPSGRLIPGPRGEGAEFAAGGPSPAEHVGSHGWAGGYLPPGETVTADAVLTAESRRRQRPSQAGAPAVGSGIGTV